MHVSSSTAAALALAEPLTAALLGVLLLNESLDIVTWSGIFLLLLGIGLLIWFSSNQNRAKRLSTELN